jgi:hypothetical protein
MMSRVLPIICNRIIKNFRGVWFVPMAASTILRFSAALLTSHPQRFASTVLYSLINQNNIEQVLHVLPDSFGFGIRTRFSTPGLWRICLWMVLVSSIAVSSFIN